MSTAPEGGAEGAKRVRRVVKKKAVRAAEEGEGAAAQASTSGAGAQPAGGRRRAQATPVVWQAPEFLRKELYLLEEQPDTLHKRQPLNFYDKQLYDYTREALGRNVWYYRDRLSVPRGPCNLTVMRDCWVHGIVDEDTLVWGQGLMDWLPIKNVRTLVPLIRIPEVRVATWIKKTFALRPALARVRRARQAERPFPATAQVDRMY